MSKTVSVALKAHLAQRLTTLALCWQVERVDGASYYFTSHDVDLVVSGQTYRSTVGFTASPIETGSTGQVDNLEVGGFFDETAIGQQDVNNGRFDYASIFVFLVNWADLTQGILRLRSGYLGEVSRSPNNFQAELRGLTQNLVQEFGTIYSPICRADLGDSRCKVPIKPAPWQPNTAYAIGDFVQAVTQTSDALLVAIFENRTGDGTSGSAEPTWSTAIGSFTSDGPLTWTSMPYWRSIGSVITPLTKSSFVSSALSFPAAPVTTSLEQTAAISFIANVAAGLTITVSDGTVSASFLFPFNTSLGLAINELIVWLDSQPAGPWGITATLQGDVIFLTNSATTQGNITKAEDTQPSLVIRDFQSVPIDGGMLTWISGQNVGRSIEIKNVDFASNTVLLWLSMFYPIQVGDRFMAYPGCDKRRDTCLNVFSNIVNMRAEPDMPGLDTVLTYPSV